MFERVMGKAELLASGTELSLAEIRSLEPEELCRRCVTPMIPRFRGRPLQERLEEANTLSTGEQMLLAFWLLYTYGSAGWLALCERLAHVIASDHFWTSLKGACDYFEQPELRAVIVDFEMLRTSADQHPTRVTELDATLARLLPLALREIAERVRREPSEFIDVIC
ncbi:MAG TPA: hypothetical protein VER96_40920 [Polyangiaceae bacterium]|nr:hypothetical protein [Polyangiaceae bacterium]